MAFISIIIFFTSFVLFIACIVGSKIIFRKQKLDDEGLNVILGAVLSLLALLIGFTMSMCISGFQQRQIAEQNEAVSIKTAYIKADLLSNQQTEVKALIKTYLDGRIDYYATQDNDLRQSLAQQSLRYQSQLWKVAVIENNDSFQSAVSDLISEYQRTLAMWTYQIPIASWILLVVVGVFSHILLGYQERNLQGKWGLLFVMPLIISLSYFIMSEIDIPGKGIIRVLSTNMTFLRDNLPLL